jgi:hypothetical protein
MKQKSKEGIKASQALQKKTKLFSKKPSRIKKARPPSKL